MSAGGNQSAKGILQGAAIEGEIETNLSDGVGKVRRQRWVFLTHRIPVVGRRPNGSSVVCPASAAVPSVRIQIVAGDWLPRPIEGADSSQAERETAMLVLDPVRDHPPSGHGGTQCVCRHTPSIHV
jgi:hypothetical protein